MAEIISLSNQTQLNGELLEFDPDNAGPFITISRQVGCGGFSLGLLILDMLNDNAAEGESWKVYHKEILARLASETNIDVATLERQRREEPLMVTNFFRFFSQENIPSGISVRKRITAFIRALAADGNAIIIGQGGAGATTDLPKGLSIRLEAPLEWRIKHVAFRDGIEANQAGKFIKKMERQREHLRKIYEKKSSHKPSFNLTYDASAFSLAQIAQHVVYALKLKGCI